MGCIREGYPMFLFKTSHLPVVIATLAITLTPACAEDNDGTPILHPVEAACIEYTMSGQMQNGTMTRCHRDNAYETYEIQNIKVGIAGFTQTQNQHTIIIGDTIYAINLATNTGTKTQNPMYEGVANAMQNADPEEVSDAFIAAMGFTSTGTTKTIADNTCTVYNSNMMGTVCLMENGLMLEQTFMGNSTVATSVMIGDGGDDANYTLYQTVPINAGPDLSNIPNLQDIMNQMPQQ